MKRKILLGAIAALLLLASSASVEAGPLRRAGRAVGRFAWRTVTLQRLRSRQCAAAWPLPQRAVVNPRPSYGPPPPPPPLA